MLSYPAPALSPAVLPTPLHDLEQALKVGKLLLHLPSFSLEFAHQTVERMLFLYDFGLQEGNYSLMSLACKCLQLGWVKAGRACTARSWEYRHLQSHPGLAHRPHPEVAQLFYRAYLQVIEDPNYYRLRENAVA
ncbi:MAG: hypothetical protein IVW51_01485 [Thermaceae bacterium]|nr:hypothetical protein [Thermaceae bacterium]